MGCLIHYTFPTNDLEKVLEERCHKNKLSKDKFKTNSWNIFPRVYSISAELFVIDVEFTQFLQEAG